MKKTFCDRCGKEINDEKKWTVGMICTSNTSYEDSSSSVMELCDDCYANFGKAINDFLKKPIDK